MRWVFRLNAIKLERLEKKTPVGGVLTKYILIRCLGIRLRQVLSSTFPYNCYGFPFKDDSNTYSHH